jgi:speckle-type POZ protein
VNYDLWPAAPDSALICIAAPRGTTSRTKYGIMLAAAGHEHHTAAVKTISAGATPVRDSTLEVPRSALLSAGGTLTIAATVRKSGDAAQVASEMRVVKLPAMPPPGTQLVSQLAALQHSGRGADVSLLCGSGKNAEQLQAHSWLLSLRSPVFAAQLSGPLAGDTSQLRVPDDIQPSVMRALLEFLYTDALALRSAEEAQHVLNAADHYGMPALVSICESKLCESLSVDNAAFTLTLAEQHNAAALKRATLAFVAVNSVAVKATPGWAHMKAACPSLLEEVIATMAAMMSNAAPQAQA